ALLAAVAAPVLAQTRPAAAVRKVRVTGIVRDDGNAITLPGIPVEVVGGETVFTDVDGRYVLELAPGTYELKVAMDGYQPRSVKVDVVAGQRPPDLNIGLSMANFAETVTVTAAAPLDAVTSTAAAQLVERKQAAIITDNLGATEMKSNGDSDAASAMTRITGLSVVDNQFVFVRGLGERYSNTTLSGAVLPTTEPDKKVVPLDLFPAGLLDSIQVNKSYSPDKSAEFAGGLVSIMPIKFPSRPVVDLSYGIGISELATGKSIPLSAVNGRDFFGFDNGVRALPDSFPANKIVRQGIYTPTVGLQADQITALGRSLSNAWTPERTDGAPGQNWGMVFGNRFGKLGIVASATHSYRENFVKERRAFYRVEEAGALEAVSDYQIETGTQRAQLGGVGNLSYQFTPNHRVSFENFYSHSGRDEGRVFEGPNTENVFYYFNRRLSYVEEGLFSNSLIGEHFLRGLSNSRIDWRLTSARATRDEPDLREVLYQSNFVSSTNLTPRDTPLLSDESQSGFRMFNNLDDDTFDVAANWSIFSTAGGRPVQWKFGGNYVDRGRDFQSRRFRYIPIVLNKDGAASINLSLSPEELYTSANVGTSFRFNEETRPTDAYEGNQTTTAGYGMVDVSFTANTRVIAGARVERFEQSVDTFDPFGLFERTVTTENNNTDFFPAVNLVQAFGPRTNMRLSYSATVNRPEFRELAPFEFTDVVGSRAVRGNPDLERAKIQNADARWELFPGGRAVLAASAFFKYFDQPIERVVIAGAQPIVTFQNADSARNFGIELEASHEVVKGLFVNANYTWVDSKISLNPAQRTVQTSLERPLAGQSKNLFNVMAEFAARGFSTRVLVNYFGDRISDVGSNQAPDILEQGRTTLDMVMGQKIGRFNIRATVDNLTDAKWRFTQGSESQREFKLGRTFGLSVGLNVF
ncbi:MAG: TonB-dependent receptor, partial [Acidobacteria bacterium]|nr:TonB-dependent receptor [Acidobacteriota bacterium]